MKKITVIMLSVLFLAGCASTPPKAAIMVMNDSATEISDSSSSALLDLKEAGVNGVRDLTKVEFNEWKKDIDNFESFSGSRTGFNRLAYEAGGVGIGMAAGIGMGTLLGYGAITSMTADDRPDNYMFSWDFDGRVLVLRKGASVENNHVNAAILRVIEKAPNDFPKEFPVGSITRNLLADSAAPRKLATESYNAKKKKVRRVYPSLALDYLLNTPTNLTPGHLFKLEMSSFCEPESSSEFCEIRVSFLDTMRPYGQMSIPQTNTIFRLIASELDEDYFIYLPPNKAIYRLPMIIRGGTGEIEYLVEKE